MPFKSGLLLNPDKWIWLITPGGFQCPSNRAYF